MTHPSQDVDPVPGTEQTLNTQARAVMGNFNLTSQLPQGTTLAFSGYMFDGESYDSVSQRIDGLVGVMQRQRTIAEIPELELVLETKLKRLDELRGHYASLLQIKESGKKLNSQQLQALGVMDINLAHEQAEIAKGEAKIAEAKAKVTAV